MDHTNLKKTYPTKKLGKASSFHFSGHVANVQEMEHIWIVCSQKYEYKCVVSDAFVKDVILQQGK